MKEVLFFIQNLCYMLINNDSCFTQCVLIWKKHSSCLLVNYVYPTD
jgi:hypothetical protein